jgi:hypothetical protein
MPSDRRWANTGLRFTDAARGKPRQEVARLRGAIGSGVWVGTVAWGYQQYRTVGGHNGHFDIAVGGDNGWGSWSGQLGAMSGDIAGVIR